MSLLSLAKRQKTDDWKTIDLSNLNWPPKNWPSEFKLNHLYEIPHLDIAYLHLQDTSTIKTKQLFFRSETLELINQLTVCKQQYDLNKSGKQSKKCSGVVVEGAPGIGKSCATWFWILSQFATEQNQLQDSNGAATENVSKFKSVLWIHMESNTCHCTIITQTQVKQAKFGIYEPEYLIKVFKLLESDCYDIIVLDGLIGAESRHRDLAECLGNNESCFHVQVTSLAFVRSSSQYQSMLLKGIQIHEMYPWSLEEYQMACSHPAFFNSVKQFFTNENKELSNDQRENLIRHKFYFAGSSSRWMFAWTFDEIQKFVEYVIGTIRSPKTHYELLTGQKSQIANGLIVNYKDKYGKSSRFYVSQYVAEVLAERCSDEILYMLYRSACNLDNRSFAEWTLVMNVIFSCRDGQFKVFDLDGKPIQIPCSDLVTVNEDFSLHPGIKNAENLVSKILKPFKCNDPGFDLFRLEKIDRSDNYHMHLYKITINSQNSFDLINCQKYTTDFGLSKNIVITRLSTWMVVPAFSNQEMKLIVNEVTRKVD